MMRHVVLIHFFSALPLKWKKTTLFSSPFNQKFRGDIQIFRDITKSQSSAVKLIVVVTFSYDLLQVQDYLLVEGCFFL